MKDIDLILRGGTVVTHEGESVSDIVSYPVAAEQRQKVAHGVSRGYCVANPQAPEGRQILQGIQTFFRPSGACASRTSFPRLTPWATVYRNSVAGLIGHALQKAGS